MGQLRQEMRTQFYWLLSSFLALFAVQVSFMSAIIALLLAR